jgi:hypothetical protein
MLSHCVLQLSKIARAECPAIVGARILTHCARLFRATGKMSGHTRAEDESPSQRPRGEGVRRIARPCVRTLHPGGQWKWKPVPGAGLGTLVASSSHPTRPTVCAFAQRAALRDSYIIPSAQSLPGTSRLTIPGNARLGESQGQIGTIAKATQEPCQLERLQVSLA